MGNMQGSTMSHACEEHLQLVSREGTYAIHGTEVPVREELYRCEVCGEEEYSFQQMQAVERQAAGLYRQQEGFLQPEEIRALRERWGLTQAQLEDALGLGRKTVARWEAGRVLQQRSLDNLLRVIDRFPQVLAFLAGQQSVDVPSIGGAAEIAEPSLRLPRSLSEQLAQRADDEGVDVNTLAVMILSQGVERRSLNRELERVNQKLDHLDGSFPQWNTAALVADEEPWLREHKQIQEQNAKAVAF